MLTPRDLAKVEFKTAFRGYNEQQVDEFVKRVVSEYEAVYRENQELKKKIAEYEQQLEEARRTQRQIDELLEITREATQEAREAAQKEAEALVREARLAAAEEMQRVRQQYADQMAKLRELQRQEAAIRRRTRAFLESLLAELDRHDEDDEESGDRLLAGLVEAAPGFDDPPCQEEE